MRISLPGKFWETISWRMRRRSVRRSLNSLRKHLAQLENGADVDAVGIKIYRDIASIEFYSDADPGAASETIWITGTGARHRPSATRKNRRVG